MFQNGSKILQTINLLSLNAEFNIFIRKFSFLRVSHRSSKNFNLLAISSLTFWNIFLTKLSLVTMERHSGQFICWASQLFRHWEWKKWPQFRIETSLSNKFISPKHIEQLINIFKNLKIILIMITLCYITDKVKFCRVYKIKLIKCKQI